MEYKLISKNLANIKDFEKNELKDILIPVAVELQIMAKAAFIGVIRVDLLSKQPGVVSYETLEQFNNALPQIAQNSSRYEYVAFYQQGQLIDIDVDVVLG